MPFGLTNHLSVFMRLMDTVLKPFVATFVVMFLEDILFYIHFVDEHLTHLWKAFSVLHEHQLYAKESKCEFFQKKIHYLGHIISDKGICMDLEKIDAILRWPQPYTLQELQMFLGVSSFYCKYICDYVEIVVPMTNQLKYQGNLLIGVLCNSQDLKSLRLL